MHTILALCILYHEQCTRSVTHSLVNVIHSVVDGFF